VDFNEFCLLCLQCDLKINSVPKYHEVAAALHKYVKLTKCSLTITDAPHRDDHHATSPMTVYFDSKRPSTPRPVRWPSKQLQAIRKQESNLGRGGKRKKKR
jgi:hypothetical protein